MLYKASLSFSLICFINIPAMSCSSIKKISELKDDLIDDTISLKTLDIAYKLDIQEGNVSKNSTVFSQNTRIVSWFMYGIKQFPRKLTEESFTECAIVSDILAIYTSKYFGMLQSSDKKYAIKMLFLASQKCCLIIENNELQNLIELYYHNVKIRPI